MDPKEVLPHEVFEKILYNINVEDLATASSVSKSWKQFIDENWTIWKCYCQQIDQNVIEKDLQQELTWKEILKRNYRKNAVLRRWKEGQYSNNKCFIDKPDDFICSLNVETWGYLLDLVCSI